MNNNGTVDKSTTYTWAGTQQATKSVSLNSVPSVVQSFSYNATGSMSSVTTTNYTSGTIASQSRVDYDYSSSGIRVKATDYTADLQTSNFTLQTSTEYLIAETNFTGHAQSIAETTRNASGQTTKRVVYTFGTDEITQTSYDSSSAGLPPTVSILHFGHDAHTSVRVLFDATAAIVQAYTYAAYGELLAIHNGLAQQVLASSTNGLESAALTRMLYNGEAFDSSIRQTYLRARWYDGHRFTTLDPFSGNARDPLSWNTYGVVHGDPVQGTDPTGRNMMGSMLSGIGIGLRIAGNIGLAASRAILTNPLLRKIAWEGFKGIGISASFFVGLSTITEIRNRWLKQSAAGLGGFRADEKLMSLRNQVIANWRNLNGSQKNHVVDKLYGVRSWGAAWDINQLTFSDKERWTEGLEQKGGGCKGDTDI